MTDVFHIYSVWVRTSLCIVFNQEVKAEREEKRARKREERRKKREEEEAARERAAASALSNKLKGRKAKGKG